MSDSEAGGTTDGTDTVDASPAAAAQEQVKRWRDVLDGVRRRADLSAKALGAIASTAIAAIGINKIQDLSPTDWNCRTVIWAGLAVFGFLLMAAVIAGFVRRLALVNEPVVMSTGKGSLDNLSREEAAIVQRAFNDAAGLHQAPSLRAYEARAARLDRIAARRGAARRQELQVQAKVIRDEVQATLGKAAADVVRRRSAQTFTGSWARSMYVLAVAGFLLFAIGTDYLAGDRGRQDQVAKTRLANDKECAAVIKAYSDVKLTVTTWEGRRCPKTTAVASTAGSDATVTELSGALQDLSTRLTACLAAVSTDDDALAGRQTERCDRIRRTIVAIAQG